MWLPDVPAHRFDSRSPINSGHTHLYRRQRDNVIFFVQESTAFDGVFRDQERRVATAQIVVPLAWETFRHTIDTIEREPWTSKM